jgi:heptosyltransferase-3
MDTSFRSGRNIAFVLSARLGDSLVMMALAHNLQRAGRNVTIFSTQISALSDWFASFDLRALPSPDQAEDRLRGYDVVVQMHVDRPLVISTMRDLPQTCFDEWRRAPAKRGSAHSALPLLGELQVYGQEVFGVSGWEHRNGIAAPPSLNHRVHRARVIIHPTAGSPDGYWPRGKYAQLARILVSRGLEPEFVVEQRERQDWLGGADPAEFKFVEARSLADLAVYLYESAWFIGSDSGVGHLASACGIPTVTICERISNMRRWKPGWSPAAVAEPVWLPFGGLRRRYWREAMTVVRVVQAFDRLCGEVAQNNAGFTWPAAEQAK